MCYWLRKARATHLERLKAFGRALWFTFGLRLVCRQRVRISMACGKVELESPKSYFLRHLLCDRRAAVLHVALPLHVCYSKISGLGKLRREHPATPQWCNDNALVGGICIQLRIKTKASCVRCMLVCSRTNISRVFPPSTVLSCSFVVLHVSCDHHVPNLRSHLLPCRPSNQLAPTASVARPMQQVTISYKLPGTVATNRYRLSF